MLTYLCQVPADLQMKGLCKGKKYLSILVRNSRAECLVLSCGLSLGPSAKRPTFNLWVEHLFAV